MDIVGDIEHKRYRSGAERVGLGSTNHGLAPAVLPSWGTDNGESGALACYLKLPYHSFDRESRLALLKHRNRRGFGPVA